MSEFIADIQEIRNQARKNIEDGAMTNANVADKKALITALQSALATEWICVLRYQQHAASAEGINSDHISGHFASHAAEELDHAKRLAERIKQLGGTPHLDPRILAGQAHSEYKEANSLAEMIKENLIAERIAIISYTDMIRQVGDSDPTTRRLLEDILEKEEEHADEMADLLSTFDARERIH